MHSNQMKMLVGLLEVIRSYGGEIEGRIRIQKAAFLMGSTGSDYFDPQEFVYHHHGPYSRALSDILHQAVAFELVEEKRDSFSEAMVRYTYRITDKGEKFVQTLSAGDGGRTSIANKIKDFHWRALELAATIVFLEQRGEASGRQDALARALSLKPQCASYVDDARKVLGLVGA